MQVKTLDLQLKVHENWQFQVKIYRRINVELSQVSEAGEERGY